MSDDGGSNTSDADRPPLEAVRYADGSLGYPSHPVGPDGSEPVDTVDLSDHTARVVTWTTATSPPPGVRSPNHLAIVEFEVSEATDDASDSRRQSGDGDAPNAAGSREAPGDDGEPVRALGQLTSDDVAIGDEVRPVYVAELRDPDAGIREPESQAWDGYRFEPV